MRILVLKLFFLSVFFLSIFSKDMNYTNTHNKHELYNIDGSILFSISLDSHEVIDLDVPFYLWDKDFGYVFEKSSCLEKGYVHWLIHADRNQNMIVAPINNKGICYTAFSDNHLRKNNVIIENTLKWLDQGRNHIIANNNGKIVGYIESSRLHKELILFDELSKSITYLNKGTKFDIHPSAINDKSWVVGWFQDGAGHTNGIFWTLENGLKVLNDFHPLAINNKGIIAGKIRDPLTGVSRAALWFNDQFIDISTALNIANNFSTTVLHITEILSINDYGQMIAKGNMNRGLKKIVFITPKNCILKMKF